MNQLLLGGIIVAFLIAGTFFLKYWSRTRDRFFLFFAASFWVEGVNRAALGLAVNPDENQPLFYIIRLLSFVLILIAIIDKNLRGKRA
jgi:uncharacterized membrane protein HdeD (DUF308 family)